MNPNKPARQELLKHLGNILRQGGSAAMISLLPESAHDADPINLPLFQDGLSAVVDEKGCCLGEAPAYILEQASRAITARTPLTFVCNGRKWFIDTAESPWRLVICGAGHIALALAPFASMLDYSVCVTDCREGFAIPESFPAGTEVITGNYTKTLSEMDFKATDAVVIVTHGHLHDQECLESLIGKNPGYIGMIGSRAKVVTCFTKLAAVPGGPGLISRVHSPVGIDIGAETPAEIAVSILAEMIAARHGNSEHPSSVYRKLDRSVIPGF